MTARLPLPPIAPCPCGVASCHCELTRSHAFKRVFSGCGWRGPQARTDRQAIELWNLRSDAEAERRGAWAAMRWVLRYEGKATGIGRICADLLGAIERGEVLPAAKQRKGAKRT